MWVEVNDFPSTSVLLESALARVLEDLGRRVSPCHVTTCLLREGILFRWNRHTGRTRLRSLRPCLQLDDSHLFGTCVLVHCDTRLAAGTLPRNHQAVRVRLPLATNCLCD